MLDIPTITESEQKGMNLFCRYSEEKMKSFKIEHEIEEEVGFHTPPRKIMQIRRKNKTRRIPEFEEHPHEQMISKKKTPRRTHLLGDIVIQNDDFERIRIMRSFEIISSLLKEYLVKKLNIKGFMNHKEIPGNKRRVQKSKKRRKSKGRNQFSYHNSRKYQNLIKEFKTLQNFDVIYLIKFVLRNWEQISLVIPIYKKIFHEIKDYRNCFSHNNTFGITKLCTIDECVVINGLNAAVLFSQRSREDLMDSNHVLDDSSVYSKLITIRNELFFKIINKNNDLQEIKELREENKLLKLKKIYQNANKSCQTKVEIDFNTTSKVDSEKQETHKDLISPKNEGETHNQCSSSGNKNSENQKIAIQKELDNQRIFKPNNSIVIDRLLMILCTIFVSILILVSKS